MYIADLHVELDLEIIKIGKKAYLKLIIEKERER